MEKLNEAVEHTQTDYETRAEEIARDVEEIFRPRIANPQAAPVFYGNSSFVLPADGTWKVMHHPGPYLNWNPRPVEEGSSDEESGESAITSSDSDSGDDNKDKNT